MRAKAARIDLFASVMRCLTVATVVLVFLARPTAAQQVPTATEDPVADAPVRLGFVAFDPRIALTQLGVDTNVFNSVENPQQDFTFGIRPGADMFMRTGRGLLTFKPAGRVSIAPSSARTISSLLLRWLRR